MPTLHRRTGERIHPKQTDYYIIAHPPDVGYVTYQVTKRPRDFLVEDLDYGDEAELAWSLVHPLRQIKDLYTLDEGRPRNATPETHSSSEYRTPQLSQTEREALVDYIRSHPDIEGDFQNFRRRLKQRDPDYLESIDRLAHSPVDPPGHPEGSGNRGLDRIAEQYWGDGPTDDYIVWNGERIHDYISVTDRGGTVHEFPKSDSRYPAGERYRFSQDLYERWGPQIGESIVNSRRYEPDDEGFPNHWIGQRRGAPEPSLDQAESPRAFFYRTIAGRSHYAPGKEAKAAFEASCEYSLEVYRANFPTAVDPNDFTTTYVVIEEATEPWQDFQVPPGWLDEYSETGGIPPLVRGGIDPRELDEEVLDIALRHAPGGTDSQWFESIGEAFRHVTTDRFRQSMLVFDDLDLEVVNFSLGGAGEPVFDVEIPGAVATVIHSGSSEGAVSIESETDDIHCFIVENGYVNEWAMPRVEDPQSTHTALSEQSRWFEAVERIAEGLAEI